MEKNKFLAYPEGQVSGSETGWARFRAGEVFSGSFRSLRRFFVILLRVWCCKNRRHMLVLRHFRRQCALQLEGEYCTEAVDSQNPPCSLPPFVL